MSSIIQWYEFQKKLEVFGMKKGCRVGGDSEEQGGHLPCQHRAQCFVGSGGESCYNWG